MNINTAVSPESVAAAAQRKNSFAGHAAAPGADAMVADTVEISPEAREALLSRLTSDEDREAMNAAFRAGYKEQAKAAAGFTEQDVAPLKDRFSKLLRKENGIFSRVSSILAKPGMRRGPFDQLKIEIDKDGKAIVGGISDVRTARALEKAVNSDKKLLNDIVAYQKEEKSLSTDLHTVTRMSLRDFSERIDTLQRGDQELKMYHDMETPGELATADAAIALRDQPLHAVDAEFAGMLSNRFSAGSARMDISGLNNILEDAQGTVDRMMRKVTGTVAAAFKDMNKAIRTDAAQADDPVRYVEDSLVDISRLKISVDNTGSVTIEGTASRNNRKTDKAAKKIIAEMFEEELKANPVTGEQHDFKIAAAYLLNRYDETFGEGNALGLGEADRTLEAIYDHGDITSRVASPEREAELKTEIDVSAKDALKDMGIDADDLVIEMNDEGRLVAANLNPDDPVAKKILNALDVLNRQLEGRTIEDARGEAGAFAADPVKRLRGLMANMDVLRPGGTELLQRSDAADA